MLSTYLFGLLFIIVLIILASLAAAFLLWLAYRDSQRRRKRRMRSSARIGARARETFRTRTEAIDKALFKLQESMQKRKE